MYKAANYPTSVARHCHQSVRLNKDDGSYSGFPEWVPEVCHVPDGEDLYDYDLGPITPGIIRRRVLSKHSFRSAPGEDNITYHHLGKVTIHTSFFGNLYSLKFSFNRKTLLHHGVMLK